MNPSKVNPPNVNPPKVNPTVVLTLVLLFLMVGAGLMSGFAGYNIGRNALKGITQPDTRPLNNTTDPKGKAPHRQGLALLREEDILASVKTRMAGGNPDAVPAAPKPGAAPTATPEMAPLSTENRSVKLTVTSVTKQGNALVLALALENHGEEAVQFPYNAVDITNEAGRLLSTDAQNLPQDLPPNGQSVAGVVRVPLNLLEGTQRLSLSLTDYSQQLQLQLSGIPVEK